MKKFKIIIYLLLLLELMILTSCVSQKPNSYLWKKDFDGLKNKIIKNPDFVKRKVCKNRYCYYWDYYSLVDLLSMHNFKGEIEDGDLLKFLIQNGAEIENKDFMKTYYVNPLKRALRAKRNYIAKILIEASANTEDVDYMQNSALMIAVQLRNNEEIIKYLISKGNNLDATNKRGFTALEKAVALDSNDKNIELLLKNGANHNFKQDIQVDSRYLSNLKLLLKYNISIILNNNYDYTKNRSTINEIVRAYVKPLNADLTLEESDYLRTIHKLILLDDFAMTEKAINLCLIKEQNCKSFLSSYTYLGVSPLMMAIEKNNYELLKFLLCKGADINKQNKLGMTALHIAILLEKKDAIKILLERNANTELKDIKGNTAKDLYKQVFKSSLPEYPKLEIKCSEPANEVTPNLNKNENPIESKPKKINPKEIKPNNKDENVIDLTTSDVESPKL